MVVVAQLVRASDCGSEGRGFESHLPQQKATFESLLVVTSPYLPLLLMVPWGTKASQKRCIVASLQ